jgi:hypothetical protein
VWGDEEALNAEDALNVLVRAGLVEALGGGHFRQHRLLRAYARALAEERGELDDASARHYAHYQALHGDFDANNDEDRHPLIQADFKNIQAALDWGLARRPVEAVNLTIAIKYYMHLREPLTVLGERLQAALRAAEEADYLLGQANTLKALFEIGQHDAGIAALRECVAIFNVIDPNRWARQAVRRLNALLARAGRTSEIQSDSPPQPETGTQAQVVMALLRQVCAQGGVEAVRALLQTMDLSKAQIKALLRQLSE